MTADVRRTVQGEHPVLALHGWCRTGCGCSTTPMNEAPVAFVHAVESFLSSR
jgi:hypothetical protein